MTSSPIQSTCLNRVFGCQDGHGRDPDHSHEHGPMCGHAAFEHEDHVDYHHAGRRHFRHADHWDTH